MASRGRGKIGLPEIREETAPAPADTEQQSADYGEKKKAMVRINPASLDAAMYKVHSKYAPEEEKQATYSHRPQQLSALWEIDPFKLSLNQMLGQGTFGTVHRGTYDGMDVAVKILTWDEAVLSGEEVAHHKQKFLREVNIMSSLAHPNVTRFIGAWAGGREYQIPSTHLGAQGTYTLKQGTHMLLMEFVSGGSLRALWINARRAGHRRLGYKVVTQLALDTARGLAYLHSKQICHRDLKPDNLLLDENLRVKIADFGESRVQAPQITDMSKNTGTFGYMAPEVLDGTVQTGYNHKCDVFSFAMVVWEIYNCDVLFSDLPPNLNIRDLALAMSQQGLRPKIPKCCPTFVKNLMTICWDSDPDKRPEMEQVVIMIEAQPPEDCGIKVAAVCEQCCLFCTEFTGGTS